METIFFDRPSTANLLAFSQMNLDYINTECVYLFDYIICWTFLFQSLYMVLQCRNSKLYNPKLNWCMHANIICIYLVIFVMPTLNSICVISHGRVILKQSLCILICMNVHEHLCIMVNFDRSTTANNIMITCMHDNRSKHAHAICLLSPIGNARIA